MAESQKRAVVLVDHGSRRAAANALLQQIAAQLRARLPGARLLCAHLELARPSLPDALDECAREGAAEITVAQCFLAPGRHAAEDIPRIVAEARARHPGVAIRVSAPLGAHSGVAAALLARIADAAPGLAPPPPR